jgi:hypothetical protein
MTLKSVCRAEVLGGDEEGVFVATLSFQCQALEATAARVCDAAATDDVSTPAFVLHSCPCHSAQNRNADTPTRTSITAQATTPPRTPPDRRRGATSVWGTTRSRKPRKHGPAATPKSRPRQAFRKPQAQADEEHHAKKYSFVFGVPGKRFVGDLDTTLIGKACVWGSLFLVPVTLWTLLL